jgi:hypothetical protein
MTLKEIKHELAIKKYHLEGEAVLLDKSFKWTYEKLNSLVEKMNKLQANDGYSLISSTKTQEKLEKEINFLFKRLQMEHKIAENLQNKIDNFNILANDIGNQSSNKKAKKKKKK